MRNLSSGARWIMYVALALAFAVGCGFLANWQFTRNSDRSAQLALIEQNYDAPPANLDDVFPAGADLPEQSEWMPVILRGEYLIDSQVLARNRPHGGTSAFEVLVPFQTDSGRILVINRGWVTAAADSPVPEAIPAPPAGPVTVVARLRDGEPLPRSGRSAPEGQVPTINLSAVASATGLSRIEVGGYGRIVSEDPAPTTRLAELPSPSEDPGPHLSYAVQWILFAVMGFVFIWYIIRTERQRRDEGAPPPRRVRRDRDTQDEDAILDSLPG